MTSTNKPKPAVSDVVIIIPAYKPGRVLLDLVGDLLTAGISKIIVVDDGSGPQFCQYFQAITMSPQVLVVQHAINLGKGAALKTGMNCALVRYPDCSVVTADADGQHYTDDIIRVAKQSLANPGTLIMGVRSFDNKVPWRSRTGNGITRILMNLVVGQKLSDTQTGLRGIPNTLIPHLLRVPSSGYDFELDMLIACKHQSCPVLEEPIRTIYLEGNKSSHFHPVLDSMRIYLVLFRFSLLALLTAALDNIIFIWVFSRTGSIATSQLSARAFATVFNYLGARGVVFHSQQRHAIVLPKYLCLVICNGLFSYALIQLLHTHLTFTPVSAKLLAEGLIFIGNFAVQRDFVFSQRHSSGTATDWDSYYTSVPITAKLTRKYTTSVLIRAIRQYVTPGADSKLTIIELGGANSCFLDVILSSVGPASYEIIDTNGYGLSLLAKRFNNSSIVHLHQESVLTLSPHGAADLVFSVGLVEHFSPPETRQAISAHFDSLRPGGIALITFPTPTLLYRITRRFIEALGMWKFHDERPLAPEEVRTAITDHGSILFEKTLWPLMLTQYLIVARKILPDRGDR